MNDASNLGLIIAIVGSAFGIIAITLGATVSLFTLGRAEANADRRDITNLIQAIRGDVQAIQLEMRDFHTRMCAIEKERNQIIRSG